MLFSEISINYKPLNTYSELPKVRESHTSYKILRTHWSDKIEYREEFLILLLNRASKVLGFVKISEGGTAQTTLDPKMIFQSALKANASYIILAHNHPSGNLRPSDADIRTTKQLVEVGKLLDINVIDHIILAENCYFSFADEGML